MISHGRPLTQNSRKPVYPGAAVLPTFAHRLSARWCRERLQRKLGACSAEGATAPETLRPKDRHRFHTLWRMSGRHRPPGIPKEQASSAARPCLVNLSGPEQRGRPLRMLRTGSTLDASGIW